MRALPWIVLAACHSPQPVGSLVNTGEASGWTRTGRYDEAVRLCHDFARTYRGVTCETLGASGEGRDLVALRIARAGAGAPEIYVQAGIHAGEIEGKDAGFWFLRDALDGKVAPGALARVNVVFAPVVNPDGHEQFGPNQRPNQRGPVEGGFRTTGARLNMNRDFVKADAPETQAVLRLLTKDRPVVFVDLHTTDGAKFEQDISVTTTPVAPRGDGLEQVAAAFSHGVAARLTALGHLPVEFYPSFITDDDPQSGFAVGEAAPRFGQFYYAARSRLGVLVETHSWRTYRERAQSTYHALQAIFELAAKEGAAWAAAEARAAEADRALAGTQVALVWDYGPHTTPIRFRGYHYTKTPSAISGADWIVYDERAPEVWTVPLHDELVPKVTVAIPAGGWIVDGGFAASVAAVLDRHGIQWRRVSGEVEVETWRATKAVPDKPFEGRMRMTLEGAWQHEKRVLERGAIFVPAQQDGVRLIAHLLDPALPDSLAQWGELAAAFEQKEYMEPYMIEQVAREMLAADPALQGQFDAAVAADPELAKRPEQRLAWFYRRSKAWDERVDLLPIYRSAKIL